MSPNCPNCGISRVSNPERFDGQTLCTQCGNQMHDHEITMERDDLASKYHRASRMFSAEWGWGHSHDCPDCAETFYCEQQGCKVGPQTCQTCEDSQAAETVSLGNDEPSRLSDMALLDL